MSKNLGMNMVSVAMMLMIGIVLISVKDVVGMDIIPKNNINDPRNFYDMDCISPPVKEINHSLDIYYGSPTYTQDLIKGSYNNRVVFTLTTIGNLSELKDYYIDPFIRIDCGNETIYNMHLFFDAYPIRLSNGTYVTEFRSQDNFRVPEDVKICRAYARVFGANFTWIRETNCSNRNISCRCFIPGLGDLYNSLDREPLTIDEYTNKQIAEITRHQMETAQRQTEIMNKQANISQQQTEIMEGNQNLEKEKLIFGFDKGAILTGFVGLLGILIGTILTSILSDLRNYQNRKKENIENIYSRLYTELDDLKSLVSEWKPISAFLKACKDRREYHDQYLKNTNYACDKLDFKVGGWWMPSKPTAWDIVFSRGLSMWIPKNLREEIMKFYNDNDLFHEYNETVPKRDNEDRDRIEKRNKTMQKILDEISHLQKLLEGEMGIGIRYYIKDKIREIQEFIKIRKQQ